MTLIFDDYANSYYYFNGHYCHQKECSSVLNTLEQGFQRRWSDVRCLRGILIQSSTVPLFTDPVTVVIQNTCPEAWKSFFPPDKKALYKDDRRSPLYYIPTIFPQQSEGLLLPQNSYKCIIRVQMNYICIIWRPFNSVCKNWSSVFTVLSFQSHFISALTVVFVNSKSLSSLKIDDTPVDDPLKVLVATTTADTLKLLKMSSCPHVSSRCGVVLPVILVKCVVFIKWRWTNNY